MDLADHLRMLAAPKRPAFTQREKRIAGYIAEGYTNKDIEIAERMTARAVQHVTVVIYSKTGIAHMKGNPRVTLARAWIKAGLDDEIKPRL